jgi:hypothetical protein
MSHHATTHEASMDTRGIDRFEPHISVLNPMGVSPIARNMPLLLPRIENIHLTVFLCNCNRHSALQCRQIRKPRLLPRLACGCRWIPKGPGQARNAIVQYLIFLVYAWISIDRYTQVSPLVLCHQNAIRKPSNNISKTGTHQSLLLSPDRWSVDPERLDRHRH